ncbi:MAG: transposase [Gemmatimonadetes bacterium]|nr:transposase [Gemmatimonadota bacterium]
MQLAFIRPGKPIKNAYVESFHDKIRAECLEQHWFTDRHDARAIISAWQDDYNTVRPHSALQQLTRTNTRAPSPVHPSPRPTRTSGPIKGRSSGTGGVRQIVRMERVVRAR